MKKVNYLDQIATRYRTNREAAEYLRVSEVTLWRLRKDGLPFHRLGGKLIYDQTDLDAYMAKQKRNV